MTAHPPPVADQRGGERASGLALAGVNPLDYADEIKALFLAHERVEFPAFFDRAYPQAVADGARSWLGRDERGRLCAHLISFQRRFRCDRQTIRGALLGNLMVATAHRSFWPGLALMRRAVRDLRQSDAADFVYADPNAAARSIIQAAGLRPAGSLRRFLLPVGDRRAGVALGISVYRLWSRAGSRGARVTVNPTSVEDAMALEPPLCGDPMSLRPLRVPALYAARLAGYPGAADRWYVARSRSALVGRALVRGPDALGRAVLCAWDCEPIAHLASLLVALGDATRGAGVTRLEVYVMAGSRAEREFRRAGFLAREERLPVLALGFNEAGSRAVAAAPEWRLLPLDFDR